MHQSSTFLVPKIMNRNMWENVYVLSFAVKYQVEKCSFYSSVDVLAN